MIFGTMPRYASRNLETE
ncbi:hypothetical protein A2U01_0117417 [Trifolium medium]|uniref:Uncharacterized protein n=1 Tax=Trifolium medium TaxID=97028 RepID=A0A392W637_9FABA|nr:hypothetical protein [Trifolium medium]